MNEVRGTRPVPGTADLSSNTFPPLRRRAPPAPLTSGPPRPFNTWLTGPPGWRRQLQAQPGGEHLVGVPWFAHPPSHHSPQPSPSLPALAQLRPRPREKGVCLPGNPSPCNRVSRDTARDALTSGPKAQASPPAGTAPSRADRRAGAALWPRRPDSASACRKRETEARLAGEAGVGHTDALHVDAGGPLPPTNTRGPAPLASPGCPLRKGGRTGSSLGESEQIPRKTERGLEEVRSTPQPTRGPMPLRGGGKAFSWAPTSAEIPTFIGCCPYHFSVPQPPAPRT